MNFQNLVSVEDGRFYLDIAFKRAKKKASEKKLASKIDHLTKVKILERMKADIIKDTIEHAFKKIEESYPSIDELPEFYKELCSSHFNTEELKKSLGSLKWARDKITELTRLTHGNIRNASTTDRVSKITNTYYGRVSSVMKQINKHLELLESTRRTMKAFPAIKEKYFTVAIVGFPNVGKSTLLSKVTASKVDINSYAFTTRTLLVGYAMLKHQKIQFVDTPGTLNRENKQNFIEIQANLAMKYVANLLIYIFDPTETYSQDKQERLLKEVKKYHKPVLLYMSKTDIADDAIIEEMKEKHPDIFTDKERLMDTIFEKSMKNSII